MIRPLHLDYMRGTARSHVLVGILVLVVRIVRIYQVRNHLQVDFGIGVKCSRQEYSSVRRPYRAANSRHRSPQIGSAASRPQCRQPSAAICLHILLDAPKVLIKYSIEARIAFGAGRACVESTTTYSPNSKEGVILALMRNSCRSRVQPRCRQCS